MGKHSSGAPDFDGIVFGTVFFKKFFDCAAVTSVLQEFGIECDARNWLSQMHCISGIAGHSTAKVAKDDSGHCVFMPLDTAEEVNTDFAVGLLQSLHRVGVINSFYLTTQRSDSTNREYVRT